MSSLSLSELLKNVNIRVKNQIVFGFICSFIIINWEAFITVITYDKYDYWSIMRKDVIEYLKLYFNWFNAFLQPLFYSIIVNLGIVFLDYIFNMIKYMVRLWYIDWERKKSIDKKAYMYYEDYDKNVQMLEDSLAKMNSQNESFAKLKLELNLAKQQIQQHESTIANLKNVELSNIKNNELAKSKFNLIVNEGFISLNITEKTISSSDDSIIPDLKIIHCFKSSTDYIYVLSDNNTKNRNNINKHFIIIHHNNYANSLSYIKEGKFERYRLSLDITNNSSLSSLNP